MCLCAGITIQTEGLEVYMREYNKDFKNITRTLRAEISGFRDYAEFKVRILWIKSRITAIPHRYER